MARFNQPRLARLSGWRGLIFPGLLMILSVCLLRLSGWLQMQEWMALDSFSRSCPTFSPPEIITLISVDETDYSSVGEFPLSDAVLLQALESLQEYEPRVIGLNLLRSFTANADENSASAELFKFVQSTPNLVVAERAFASAPTMNTTLPSDLPAERVGFVDSIVDSDGGLRRSLLAARSPDSKLKYSLALQLVKQYLQAEGIPFEVETGIDLNADDSRSIGPIRLGGAELTRLHPNSGGYVRANTEGYQSLIHFCALQKPFETVRLRDLLSGKADKERLHDRIALIGNITTSLKDSFITSSVRETLYSQQLASDSTDTNLIYGVEIQGLVAKQILNSAMERPCMLNSWTDPVEYLWIVSWGLLGIAISIGLKSPWKSGLALTILTLLLMIGGRWLIIEDWWIPVVPTVLALCSAGLVTAFLDWDMRFELAQRKLTVERTYQAVHNGPLQRLATILRGSSTFSSEQMQQQLQALNTEMRNTFEYMRQEANAGSHSLYFANVMLDLRQPLAMLLYQVYDATLDQPLPGFSSVRSYIPPDFECLNQSRFSLEEKRGLCLFLQEALVNVGKYAAGATRIDVVCTAAAQQYRLQVIDNAPGVMRGANIATMPTGEGTRQAVALAQSLGGEFRRLPNSSQGTICELLWPQ